MKYITVPTTLGDVREVVYNVNDFPYNELVDLPIVRKKTKKETIEYYNVSASFDIESTTIEPPKDSDGKYLIAPFAFMYQWQACVCGKVVFGRYWEEFTNFLDRLRNNLDLGESKRLAIYVHNLAYEFQFMKDFLRIDNLFAKDKRKPLRLLSEGIEFRCSYTLSNRSLASFCENSRLCTHYKLTDTYDYRKIRTPETPLSEEEEGYCFNDVKGLCECIDTLLLEDTIVTIPMTNTGYVRRDFRQAMKNPKLRSEFMKAKLNASEYSMLKRAFRGGNTHANRFMANMVLKNVYSFDISSSYPSAMLMDNFPMDKFTAVTLDSQEKLDYYTSKYCVVMDVSFFNLELKENEVIPYVDIAHCFKHKKIVNDNGRVLSAEYVKMTITNIDLDIIRKTYDMEGLIVHKAMFAERGKLPEEFRNMVMKYYTDKTQLKDIEGREYDYSKSKNRVNSSFGMCVTDIAHGEVIYNSDSMEWIAIDPDLEEAIGQFYKSRNNFLWYQWGVFITANARKRLQDMLAVVGHDVVYTDTDSIKFINEFHIEEFNNKNIELMKQAEENDIPAYVDREIKTEKERNDTPDHLYYEYDGKQYRRYHLGTWDNDGNYIEFKTLGAKKYAYTKMKKGKEVFEVTVSGMGKKKGAERVGNINNFKIGKTFHDIGRTTSWYNDQPITTIEIDGATFTTASNIGVVETTYTLGVTNEYWELIYENGTLVE